MNGWRHEKTVDLIRDNLLPSRVAVAHNDNRANEWIVHVREDGSVADLSTYTAQIAILRSDRTTAVEPCEISGSKITVVIPVSAYETLGLNRCSIILNNSETSQRITIDILDLEVVETATNILPPESKIVEIGGEILETEAKTLTGAINEIFGSIDKSEIKFFISDVISVGPSSYKDLTFSFDSDKTPLCAFTSIQPQAGGASINPNVRAVTLVSGLRQGYCKVTVRNIYDITFGCRVACAIILRSQTTEDQ